MRLSIGLALWWCMAATASAWEGEAGKYVAELNSKPVRQELGLRKVQQPNGSVNQLDVVFRDGVSSDQRMQVLKRIGNDFMMLLAENPGMTTVTIVERDRKGAELNRAVVRIAGGAKP